MARYDTLAGRRLRNQSRKIFQVSFVHKLFFQPKKRRPRFAAMGIQKTSTKTKAAVPLKSPKLTSVKGDKASVKITTGVDSALVQKAVQALLKYHEKQTADKNDILGNDRSVQVQFTLLRTPGQASHKPTRILIPNPLFQTADASEDLDEPEICLIVKEESKPWCQEMIEKFPEQMGCVKKVLGLDSLRKKHARYEQRRELLHKYNLFMADDRILPMLSKALGKDFYKNKKLPIPISLTRKEALPFAIQKAMKATYMSINTGTCVTIRAGSTAMSVEQLTENINSIAEQAVPKLPHKWANVQNIAIRTPESIALPIYSKTPEVLRELAIMAGITQDIDTIPKEETESKQTKQDKEDKKKRELKSPLLRALKKQKREEAEAEEKEKAPKKKESKKAEKAKVEEKAEKTPKKQEKKETPKKAEKAKVEEKAEKTPKKQEKKETPKKAEKAKEKPKKEAESKEFIASKKFTGSKKGYVFKMGKQGLGYYVDIKPKVDRMAMEAFTRTAKNQQRRGGQKKNKYKGTRRF
eukprot:Nitzschia sp. Nitz4//scaffold196_size54656//30409//32069//NITZ4_006642-RA/size54656-snap-gene-0.32-mRNA-1//-1//CDS//3329540435//8382//frame0